MEHYAAILNLEDADSYCLQEDELFEPALQDTIAHSVLLGYGQTKHAALAVALHTLKNNGLLKVYKCGGMTDDILKSNSGKNALRHLWLYAEKEGTEPLVFALPGHSEVVTFCRRHNLSEEATEDLFLLVSKLL